MIFLPNLILKNFSKKNTISLNIFTKIILNSLKNLLITLDFAVIFLMLKLLLNALFVENLIIVLFHVSLNFVHLVENSMLKNGLLNFLKI